MTLSDVIPGTWTLVSSVDIEPDGRRFDTWGADPLGTYMFDRAGRFAQIVMRSDLPSAATREAMSGEDARAVFMGSISNFGTYRVDEAASAIIVRFEGSTFARFTGTEGRREVTVVSADEIVFRNAGRAGGRTGQSVWRRVG